MAMRDLHIWYRKVIVIIISVLVLAMIWMRLSENDYMSVQETDPGYVEDSMTQNGDRILAEGLERIYLYPGEYRLSIGTTVSNANIEIQVYDKFGNYMIAEQPYDPDSNIQFVYFTTDKIYEDVVVRSVTSNSDLNAGDLQITDYYLISFDRVCADANWSVALLVMLAIWVYLGYRRLVQNGRAAFLILTAGSMLTSLPFYSEGMQNGHDLPFHLARIVNIGRAISEGYFPERLNALMGGGTIIPIMYPEVFLIGAGFMVSTGATVFLAYKVLFTCITFATAYVGYYAARQVVDEQPALLFAILWLVNPFRMNELLVRAALGEALALIFLPLVALGIWQIFRGSCRQGCWSLVIGYTGLLFSHVLTTLIAATFCAIFVVGQVVLHPRHLVKEIYRIGWLIVAAVTTILLNMYFLVPFLSYLGWDMHLSNGENAASGVQASTAPLWQLFMGATGYGYQVGGSDMSDEMPLSVGPMLLFVVAVWIYYAIRKPKDIEQDSAVIEQNGMARYIIVISAAAVFLSSRYFPWNVLVEHSTLFSKTFGSVQFAWRFMMIPACLLSFLSAVLIYRLLTKHNAIRHAVATGLLIMAGLSAVSTATFYYSSNDLLSTDHFDNPTKYNVDYILESVHKDHREDLRVWLTEDFAGPRTFDEKSSLTIEDYHRDGINYEFIVSNSGDEDIVVTVPVFWYGLHRAYLIDTSGEMELSCTMNTEYQFSDVSIPAGTEHATIRLSYNEPGVFRVGTMVSVVTAIVLIADRVLHWWRHHRRGVAARCMHSSIIRTR